MLKFPIRIEKEDEINLTLLRELLVIYSKNIVKSEGDYLDCYLRFDGEIYLTLHDGKITKGSKASVNFQKEKVYVKMMDE